MNIPRRIALALLWLLSLAATAAWSTARAQDIGAGGHSATGTIITGEDLGFRVESRRDGVPTGTLVVRIDGKWVEARSSLKLMPVK